MPDLSSLIGQETAIGALRRALEADQLPGAYLFVGVSGVGKSALARAFAKAAACTSPIHSPFDSCGVCDSCRRVEAGLQPEIITVRPAGEQMQIWQFWDRANKPDGVLTHTLSFAPGIGRRRIYILENAEALTESAANSLLKALEEPPPYAIFILLASHTSRMLPTIVSRSQVIRLHTLPIDDLAVRLQARTGLSREKSLMLAAYSEGRIGQAMQMAQHPVVGEEIELIMDFARSLPEAPRARALKIAEQIRKQSGQLKALIGEEPAEESAADDGEGGAVSPKERAGRRQLAALFDLLQAFYRDLLALRVGGSGARIINREHTAQLLRLAQAGTPERWMRCLDALLIARRRLDAKANIALVTEVLAMTLVDN